MLVEVAGFYLLWGCNTVENWALQSVPSKFALKALTECLPQREFL